MQTHTRDKFFCKTVFRLLLLSLLMGVGMSFQDKGTSDENTLKALFIYNFTKHIEWPASFQQLNGFTISIYGKSPVKESLEEVMKGRKIFDKNVIIKVIASESEIGDSQILFIPKSQSHKLNGVLEQFADKGILIITEERGMITKGTGINIVEKDNHLRFELNNSALKKQGLKVSNQLNNLAINNR